MLAIIGGTGLAQLNNLVIEHRQVVRTPYGEPSGPLTFGHINQHQVVFLARHGYGHTIPPHEINYRANLWALHSQHVKQVLAVASVGGIGAGLVPGSLVLPDQLIDYTYGRKFTYFEGGDKPVVHVDFTEPYAGDLRGRTLAAAQALNIPVVDGGTYGCTQGPRLETAAEIRRLERDGCTMVGMTGMPEAVLARELGMEYMCLALVANDAAGKGQSSHAIPMDEVNQVLETGMAQVRQVIEQLLAK